MQTPKVTKRFLPTLTEVVKPAAAPQELQESATPGADVACVGLDEALVEAVLQRVLPELEQRIHAALQESLQAQWNAMLPAVLDDVRGRLREMVSDSATSVREAQRP